VTTTPYPAIKKQSGTSTVFRLSPEDLLQLIAGLFLLVNFLALTILNPGNWLTYGAAFGMWVVCIISGQFVLNHKLPHRDKLLFPVVMFLSGWGLVLIGRLEPPFAARQTIWLPLSVVAMLCVASFPQILRLIRHYRYLLLLGGLVLLTSTILFGRNPSGQSTDPQLWLWFGTVYFQPSELLKIVLVAFLASYLAEQYPLFQTTEFAAKNRLTSLSPRIAGPVLLMWGLTILILVWQRDLGTAMLFFVVFLILLYVASGYTPILIGGFALLVLAGIIAYTQFDVVRLRVDIWLNPWPEANDRAFQIVQSLQAFAAGGVFGQGIAQGSPTYIPVVHSDFVFAALAEEYGLLGVIVVLICITLIVVQSLKIAQRRNHPFHALFAIGLSGLIATQSILIMGGTLRILPLTGVTLPFLSYGGSSLLMSFVIMGLLIRLSAAET
jgi:cell division protein FtsW (lipid II flippase)